MTTEQLRKRKAKPHQLEKIAAARVQLSQLPESSLNIGDSYSIGSVERWKANTTQHLFEDPREETIIEETAFSLDAGSGSLTVAFGGPTQNIGYGGDSTVASSLSKSSWTTTTREARVDPSRLMANEDLKAVRAMHQTRKTPKRRSAKSSNDVSQEKQQYLEDCNQGSPALPEETKLELSSNHDVNSRGRARHRRRSLKFTHEEGEEEDDNTIGEMAHNNLGETAHNNLGETAHNNLGETAHPLEVGIAASEMDVSSRSATTTTTTATRQSSLPVSQSENEIPLIEPKEGGFSERHDDHEHSSQNPEQREPDDVQLPPESSSQTPQLEENHTPTQLDNAPTTPIPEDPNAKLTAMDVPAPQVITPPQEGQNIDPRKNLDKGQAQAHEITPKTARTSNRKVGSKSPRRFGGPENLPLVSPKLITRRIQGTSRQSPRVHGLRVTPRGMKKEYMIRPSVLPPSGSVPRDNGMISMTALETSGSSTARNSLESMTVNVHSFRMPPFATDAECDSKLGGAGPLTFPDDSNPELLRLCNKLRKKLNLDPWDEFKRFDDEEFTDFVQTYPQTCRVRYSFDYFTGKLLPLSIVCTMGANVETVRATWEAFPQALLECDDWIGTPLHYACSYQAKKSVVKFLIQRDYTMLEQINQFGRTPLHMACLFKAPVQTIEPLIEVFPQAMEILDKDGYCPLHLACENGSSLEVIQALLEVSSQDNLLIGTSERDLTPLHIACASNASKAVIQALINHCPDATDQLDHDGQLPLHHAVHASVPQAIIELLVQAFPRSVEIPNARGQTAYRIAKRKHMPETVLDLLDEEVGYENDKW